MVKFAPARLGKRFSYGPAGARIMKKQRKIKNKDWGVICAPRAQHGRVLDIKIKLEHFFIICIIILLGFISLNF